MEKIVLKNGRQSITFIKKNNQTFSPEWFREDDKLMLRFKDHEFLNIGFLRIKEGILLELENNRALFGGKVYFADVEVLWKVEIAIPEDKKSGFLIETKFMPVDYSIEVLEGLSFFETPYEYDDNCEIFTFISQQPVYYFKNGSEISGAGFNHPFWYYAKFGSAHLTAPSSTPFVFNQISNSDGTNQRNIIIIGNWNETDIKDIFVHPTRKNEKGLKGMKFLVGGINWNNSLYKDPNILVKKNKEIKQKLIIDYTSSILENRIDKILAEGWERCLKIHFPENGEIESYKTHKKMGISWLKSADYLSSQFNKDSGLYNPEKGVRVYLEGTRPKWDDGVALFCGQWIGPLSYLGYIWNEEKIIKKTEELEKKFCEGANPEIDSQQTWTIGPTPFYIGALRKLFIMNCLTETLEIIKDYTKRRNEFILNPLPKTKKGDGGVLVWDTFLNFLSYLVFKDEFFKNSGKELLEKANKILEEKFWNFNCASENDFVGAGQARPFGHAVGISANILAYNIFKDEKYLLCAEKFSNFLISSHFITYNESKVKDMDTRGWAHGSTGGRDQYAQMPPWETEFSLQQISYLLLNNIKREGFYDILWLHNHTGFAQFPAARLFKRIYDKNMNIKYIRVNKLKTEEKFYKKYPYISYENPWDQTMLAGYQSVEPIILSLFYGEGIVYSSNDKVLSLIPQVPVYDKEVKNKFIVELWNPLEKEVRTKLIANIIKKTQDSYKYDGLISGFVSVEKTETEEFYVPPRKVIKFVFEREKK